MDKHAGDARVEAPRRIRDEASEYEQATAARAMDTLAVVGVLIETTGKKRDRWYSYQAYLERLRVGTDLDLQRRARFAERHPPR
jgi:hypothetical protein